MALKRINKELTDLGRYVISPISPLAIISSLLSLAVHRRTLQGGVFATAAASERGICCKHQNNIHLQPCSVHDADGLGRGDGRMPEYLIGAETAMLTFNRQ